MIGHLDQACVQGMRDARAGRFEPRGGRQVRESYQRAWKRESKRMAELGALAQLELWEAETEYQNSLEPAR